MALIRNVSDGITGNRNPGAIFYLKQEAAVQFSIPFPNALLTENQNAVGKIIVTTDLKLEIMVIPHS